MTESKCKYRYIGCFFNKEYLWESIKAVDTNPLYKVIEAPHITFKYRPEFVDESLFGEEIQVKVLGYGNDGQNEGLLVELHTENATLTEMANSIEVQHITLSIGVDAEAVDTKYLDFTPIEPFYIVGHFGGFIKGGIVDTEKR